jgi:hypothetical protein
MSFFSRLFSRKAEPVEPVEAPNTRMKAHGVAGINYHQEDLQAMGRKNPDYDLNKRELLKRWPKGVTVYEYTFSPTKAELVPEPDNPKDPKAIKVLIDGVHVGYIKAGSCAHIHRLIRENRIQKIEPKIIGGKYKAVFSLDVNARHIEDFDFEKGTTLIGVRLEITELLDDKGQA